MVPPKGVYLPISKLHSILAVANLLAHNNLWLNVDSYDRLGLIIRIDIITMPFFLFECIDFSKLRIRLIFILYSLFKFVRR